MKSLYTLLKVKPEESTQVTLMLAMGFFMGIFIATYTVTAESLFLNKLSEHLDKAFLAAGVLGIVSTLIFSMAQARVKFTYLAISSIGIIVAFSSIVYVLYHFGELWYRDYVLFVMFILTGPMTAVLFLCYWGIFGRLFDFRQSKRIIGWIDTGQLLAAILAFLIIPLTSNLIADTSNYLVLCNISIVASAACLVTISLKFNLTGNKPAELDQETKRETSFGKITSDKYLFLLSVFLIISMVTVIFNQFAFQDTLNEQYPEQRELTNFLAWFNGTIYILSLAMQSFINDKILGNYGIRVSLLLLPIIIAIFAVGSVFTGTFFGFNIEQAPTTFIFFFLTIALTRLFSASLRDSLENPRFLSFCLYH
ncbi:MAG: hypothetical protein HC811_02040 [Flammeovirgaceae bacterium]|nr:hypothetical protein [Flammeovirgaceae bacterium]